MNKKIVVDHMPLAVKMARIKSKSVPPSVSFEELESAAYMGLVDAASRFDPEMGFAFSSYARMRIEGEMRDYMRGNHRPARFIMDGEDFAEEARDECSVLEQCSAHLDDREVKILSLYYIENRPMKEIGFSEGVSESRVSQILNSCRKKLRRRMPRGNQ